MQAYAPPLQVQLVSPSVTAIGEAVVMRRGAKVPAGTVWDCSATAEGIVRRTWEHVSKLDSRVANQGSGGLLSSTS